MPPPQFDFKLAILLLDQIEGRLEARLAAVVEHGVVAGLVDVIEGGDAGVGLVEELLHVVDAHGACADDGDVDFAAGGRVAGEYVRRYDAESGGG